MLRQPYLSLGAGRNLWWVFLFFLNWLYPAFSTATSVSVMAATSIAFSVLETYDGASENIPELGRAERR
ncbi:hypothetical protein Tco_0415013 [Tanacetum coccineum]